MKLKLTKIGNSYGVIIPKKHIKDMKCGSYLDVEIKNVITSDPNVITNPRNVITKKQNVITNLKNVITNLENKTKNVITKPPKETTIEEDLKRIRKLPYYQRPQQIVKKEGDYRLVYE